MFLIVWFFLGRVFLSYITGDIIGTNPSVKNIPKMQIHHVFFIIQTGTPQVKSKSREPSVSQSAHSPGNQSNTSKSSSTSSSGPTSPNLPHDRSVSPLQAESPAITVTEPDTSSSTTATDKGNSLNWQAYLPLATN